MVDFQDLKARIAIADVAAFLGLTTRENNGELRAPCPRCNEGGDRALMLNADGTWKCWASKKSGDIIGLVAHVKDVGMRQAGEQLAEHFKVGREYKGRNGNGNSQAPAPAPAPTQQPVKGTEKKTSGMAPIAHLDPKHELVQKVGFSAEVAERLGVGFAAKGILKGTVGIPIRAADGTLTGYLGVTEAKHPKEWKVA